MELKYELNQLQQQYTSCYSQVQQHLHHCCYSRPTAPTCFLFLLLFLFYFIVLFFFLFLFFHSSSSFPLSILFLPVSLLILSASSSSFSSFFSKSLNNTLFPPCFSSSYFLFFLFINLSFSSSFLYSIFLLSSCSFTYKP